MTYEPLVAAVKDRSQQYTIVTLKRGPDHVGTHVVSDNVRVRTLDIETFDETRMRDVRGLTILKTLLDDGITEAEVQDRTPTLYQALCNGMVTTNGQFIRTYAGPI